MKKYLTLILILCSLNLYATWRTNEEICKDLLVKSEDLMNIKDGKEWQKIYGSRKEFGLRVDKKTTGIHLSAVSDIYGDTSVNLRSVGSNLDIQIHISRLAQIGHTEYSSNIYLNLLDDDKYLIKTIFIDSVNGVFEGYLYRSTEMEYPEFQKIKRYEIVTREKK